MRRCSLCPWVCVSASKRFFFFFFMCTLGCNALAHSGWLQEGDRRDGELVIHHLPPQADQGGFVKLDFPDLSTTLTCICRYVRARVRTHTTHDTHAPRAGTPIPAPTLLVSQAFFQAVCPGSCFEGRFPNKLLFVGLPPIPDENFS